MTFNVYIGRETEFVGRVWAFSRREAYALAREQYKELLARKDPLTGKLPSLFVSSSSPGC